MHFRPTVPADTPELMRISTFRRQLESEAATTGGGALSTRQSQLSSRLGESLMQDLVRFEREGHKGELLEVLAACVRHGRSLLVHLQIEDRMLPLSVFPTDGLVHMPLPLERFLEMPLGDLRVVNYEPPTMRPPSEKRHGLARLIGADAPVFLPLAPLLWELALRGSRDELLPEIAGNAAYRIAPGMELQGLNLTGSLAAAAQKLQKQTSNLREIAAWPGFDRQRAMRMLNGLYLQAGLVISRTHPAATSEA
jgi:hypothetical protein